MELCKLIRISFSNEGTWGVFFTPYSSYKTIELPWHDNERNFSCIPKGLYEVIPHHSQKFGDIYWIQDVPDRSKIYIHSGNYAGDTRKGFLTHSLGCILPGDTYSFLDNQRAVLNSKTTLRKIKEALNYKPFWLEIK